MRLATTALVAIASPPAPHTLLAQAMTTAHPTELLATPGGRSLASVRGGVGMAAEPGSGAFVRATLEGWIARRVVGPARDSFPATAAATTGGRLRLADAPDATVVADLRPGVGLAIVEGRRAWVRVRRVGWVRRSDLTPASPTGRETAVRPPGSPPYAPASGAPGGPAFSGAAAASLPSPAFPAPGAEGEARSPAAEPPVSPIRPAHLSVSPGGTSVAAVEPGARFQPLAHERGWVRVRLEGWVREDEVATADSTLMAPTVSAADLRADPEGARGKTVRWDVQVLKLQSADPLRKGLAVDEPYLLVRGPGSENTLLYVAVPARLLDAARALPALASVTITARVRTARSEPVGTPVLDLLGLTRR